MTQGDAIALNINDKVGFQNGPGTLVIPATVIQNGPRTDPPIPYMNELLMIQLDGSPMTISWEPVNHPQGIPQLFAANAIGTSP